MGYGVLDRAEVTRTKKLTWLGQTFYSEAIMTEPLKFTVDGKDWLTLNGWRIESNCRTGPTI